MYSLQQFAVPPGQVVIYTGGHRDSGGTRCECAVRYRAGAGPGRPLQDERSIFPQLRRTHLLKGLLQGPDSGAGACEVVVPGVQRCCSLAALTTLESRHKSSIMLLLHMFHGVPVFRLFSSPGDWGAA